MNGPGDVQPQGLLVFVWGGIGNMAMSLPMLRALRSGLPQARISLAVQSAAMSELVDVKEFHAVIALSNNKYRMPFGLAALARDLWKTKADVALSSVPWPDIRCRLLARLSGARQVHFLPGGRAALRRNYAQERRHNIDLNLEIAALALVGPARGDTGIAPGIADDGYAKEIIDQFTINKYQYIAGLHPGAGDARKRFGEALFIELGRRLAGAGHAVVVLGGAREQELRQRVAAGIGPGALATPPGASLRQTLGVIKACRLVIANDSGLAHCAAGLGVPTVALFGPTDEKISGPQGRKVTIVTNCAHCRPCYFPAARYGCSNPDRPCLLLTADEVIGQLDSDMKAFFVART